MNYDKFKEEYYEKCTENSLLPYITVKLLKGSIWVFSVFVLLLGFIIFKVQSSDKSISYLLIGCLVILILYVGIIVYTGRNGIEKKTKMKPEGIFKFSNDETRNILDENFIQLLNDYNINIYSSNQIDIIIDVIESSRSNDNELLFKSLIPGAIIYKVWETLYDRFAELSTKYVYAILSIFAYIILLLLWYLFKKGYLYSKRELDRELILRLKAMKSKEYNIRKRTED